MTHTHVLYIYILLKEKITTHAGREGKEIEGKWERRERERDR